jgi:hypothetical protein
VNDLGVDAFQALLPFVSQIMSGNVDLYGLLEFVSQVVLLSWPPKTVPLFID